MTTARFNYRVQASPEGDPVRAQGQSVVRLVKLFKEHMGPARAAGSSFTADAKGTVDRAFFAQVTLPPPPPPSQRQPRFTRNAQPLNVIPSPLDCARARACMCVWAGVEV